MKIIFRLLIFLACPSLIIFSQEKRFITVAQDGSGDFKTITSAIQSLQMFNYQRTIIFVRNGTYNEKIRIDQDYITLKGESREKTILKYSQLRTDWIANKDSIGPAVINLSGDDFILENMSVENTQPQVGPHAFTVYGTGTRTVIINCNLISKGGDTVSLWDHKTGMYYHTNCYFEGAVDFVCPRGWCYISDSKFYEIAKTAALWHAGGDNINQKFVLKNCSFDGVNGFNLGRHHYEAQFFLIDCSFSDNMNDKPIYRVVYEDSTRNRPFNWGKRYFYFNSHGEKKDFSWHKNNFTNTIKINPKDITAKWTFNGKWDPESLIGPKIIKYIIEKKSLLLLFDEKITVIGIPVLKSTSGKIFTYISGAGSDTIRFLCGQTFSNKDLQEFKISNDASMFGNTSSKNTRHVNLMIYF
jgi:pectinesterase